MKFEEGRIQPDLLMTRGVDRRLARGFDRVDQPWKITGVGQRQWA